MLLSPSTFFHVTNPRKVLFRNIAQPVSRATVTAFVCPTWRDTTQSLGFHHTHIHQYPLRMISAVGDAWGTRAARAGDAFERGNQAFSCAPARFPRLRLFLHHPILSRFPAPLPAVFVHPLLVSLFRVVCCRISPLAAGRTLGRRRGITVKYEKGNVVDYSKAAARVSIRGAAQSDRSRAERPGLCTQLRAAAVFNSRYSTALSVDASMARCSRCGCVLLGKTSLKQ
jgi:hypothetical protein